MTYHGFDPTIETAVLTKTPTEWEAQLIANVLDENNIKVSLEGTRTSAFQAEAPGEVRIVVREEDLKKAERLLERYREGPDGGSAGDDKDENNPRA